MVSQKRAFLRQAAERKEEDLNEVRCLKIEPASEAPIDNLNRFVKLGRF